ncbi:hypothetical protein BJ912DRAFT_929187 [Pholiota molesta]|nr:hypothetical protein BJ912DRAFT_929187 [Pholiota molesta]
MDSNVCNQMSLSCTRTEQRMLSTPEEDSVVIGESSNAVPLISIKWVDLRDDTRLLHNGVMISQEFRRLSNDRIREICAHYGFMRFGRRESRSKIYNIILALDEASQNIVVNAARREIFNGRVKNAPKVQSSNYALPLPSYARVIESDNTEPYDRAPFALERLLESPVQSGFLPIFGKTETETGLSVFEDRKKPDWTDLNRSFAVSIGSKTGYDRLRSKPVSTGPRPVQTGNS